jgi:hypothetical protein
VQAGEPFPWQGKTDSYGRFVQDSAPANPMSYRVTARGFQESIPLVLEPAKDHEIKLRKLPLVQITGRVVDSKTKMPIDRFTVSASSTNWAGIEALIEGTNGEFALSFYGQNRRYGVKIDAAGYRSDISQSVQLDEGKKHFLISLFRENGPYGIVRFRGEPVVGASVFLFGGRAASRNSATTQEIMRFIPMMSGPKSLRSAVGGLFNDFATTDEAGRFMFSPMAEVHTVIASDERGFVAATVDHLAASQTLTLEPWGRVEGTLRIGDKVGANQPVRLRTVTGPAIVPGLLVQLRSQCDADGKFELSMVPPGEYRVTSGSVDGPSAIVTVQAGSTALIDLREVKK